MVRCELAAVADGQLDFGGFAGVDHRLAFLSRDFHRLFAEDMFAGLRGANRVLAMHGIGQNNVNDIDLRIASDLIEGLVIVNILLRNFVFVGPNLFFSGRAGNDGRQTAEFRFP